MCPRGEAVSSFHGVVLAGGRATRLGGADKATVTVGGVTLLERAVNALSDAGCVICVGPERPTSASLVWTREQPAGGGPAAALEAGVRLVRAPITMVLAVDLPFVTADLIDRLVNECGNHDAALVADEDRVPQPLVGAYRTDSLRRRFASLGDVAGVSMQRVLDGLSYTLVEEPAAARDCDTWADVEAARELEGA